MSFIGKLLSITDGPMHTGNKITEHYPTWRYTVDTSHGVFSACSGRQDIRDRAMPLIGKTVIVMRGERLGIVGGVREYGINGINEW